MSDYLISMDKVRVRSIVQRARDEVVDSDYPAECTRRYLLPKTTSNSDHVLAASY